MNNQEITQNPLGTEPIKKLIVKYSIPVSYTHLKGENVCGRI